MTISETDALTILVVAYPVLVVAMALLVMWLTHLQDAREDRRRAQRLAAGE
jgi:hypothetical protein